MKKNKLYTANKWNRPAFMPKEENLFVGGGGIYTPSAPTLAAPTVAPPINWSNPVQRAAALGQTSYMANNVGNPAAMSVQQSNQVLSNSLNSTSSGAGAAATGVGVMPYVSAGLGLLQGIGTYLNNKKILDTTDYSNYYKDFGNQTYSGDFNSVLNQRKASYLSKVPSWRQIRGMSSGDKFASAVGSGVSGAMAGAGFGLPGVLVGAGVGTLLSLWGSSEGDKAAKRRENELRAERESALADNTEAYRLGMQNASADANRLAMMNLSAFGGPLEMPNTGSTVLDYGLALDLINTKRQNNQNKSQMTNLFAGTPNGLFAFGGDMQSHGADWPTKLTHIDAGKSHEENPNEGVQLGVDPEGTPNLVEEGETVFDDYVYSNRILADAQTKEKFGLPRKKDITFADISKKLEKESSERPNDPISQAGLKAQMHQLADEQERQKQEMDAQRAKAAFEALSPEEQVAVMEGAAQQEAMAEQAAMQQPSPEEIAMAQQQQAMADGTEAMVGQEPQMNCFGGRINRFDNGGQAYTKMLNSLGFHTQKEFDDWAKENSIDFGDIWKDSPNTLSIDILGKLWSNEKFKEALKKKNPALAHAFETKGYDFGTYVPTNNSRATIQSISKGNWKATNGQGWFGSEDLAFKQATEGMSENEIKALTTEQLAERMAKTDAYKNTSKWLENSDNALMYLNTLLNDPDTPDVAKKHALQYVKDGKWKDGYKYNYNDVFGKVRSTNPGTYWHTAMEANRGNEANNFVINEDGSIEPILGNVPTDWTSAGNYSWADENSDYTYNYYKRPAVASKPEAAKTPEEKAVEEAAKNLAPKRSWEGWRYAGLFGPLAGLGLQAAGVGKPDTSGLDLALSTARGEFAPADTKYIGNYLKPHIFDKQYYANQLAAQAGATRDAIFNNANGNRGTAIAGLIAADNNAQNALGNLFRQAEEYQLAADEKVEGFNKDTNKFNASAYNSTSQFNAAQRNQRTQHNAQLAMEAAREKMAADAGWYNSLYGNIGALTKGIADIGTENKRDNMINWMISKGIFGAVDPNDPEMKKRVKVVSAEGGKLKKNKRRGLTF